MSSIAYLPHVSPPDNNTRQMRRRANDMVSQVSQQVGAIATNTGDLGALNQAVQGKAPIDSPAFTGQVTLQSAPHLTAANTTSAASAGGATALPATPAGYLVQVINGRRVKLPYFLE